MASPQQTYDEALLRACEAHLARVKAVRDIRDLAISKAKTLASTIGELTRRGVPPMPRLNRHMTKRYARSEAQRAKDEAIALDMFQATDVTASRTRARG